MGVAAFVLAGVAFIAIAYEAQALGLVLLFAAIGLTPAIGAIPSTKS